MTDRATISIPAPQFEQYELVTLHWNDKTHSTKIIRRCFNADCASWEYETTVGQPRLYPEGSLEAM